MTREDRVQDQDDTEDLYPWVADPKFTTNPFKTSEISRDELVLRINNTNFTDAEKELMLNESISVEKLNNYNNQKGEKATKNTYLSQIRLYQEWCFLKGYQDDSVKEERMITFMLYFTSLKPAKRGKRKYVNGKPNLARLDKEHLLAFDLDNHNLATNTLADSSATNGQMNALKFLWTFQYFVEKRADVNIPPKGRSERLGTINEMVKRASAKNIEDSFADRGIFFLFRFRNQH
jgi:hypothetical protein